MKGTIVKCLEEMVVGQFGQDTWEIIDHTNGRRFSANPIPPFMQGLIEASGLMAYVLKRRQG